MLTPILVACGLTILGKALAFLRDVVLAYFFGSGVSTDAYFIANAIPGLLWTTIWTTIAMVFLPLYVERRTSNSEDVDHFVNEVVRIYAYAGLFMTGACIVGSGAIVHLTAGGANHATLTLARHLTEIMSLGFVFSGYVGVQNALQQANGRYIAPLFVPVVTNSMMIIGIALAALAGSITVAVYAAVGGWILLAPITRAQTRRYYKPMWRMRLRQTTVRRLVLLSGPVMCGVLLDQINIYVGIAIASGFAEGAISHLNFASRLANFLATTFSWLVAYFLFPRIAAAATRRDDAALGRFLALGIGLVAALTTPPVVVSLLMGREIIGIVYGRGAYSPDDVLATAAIFSVYCYGVVFIGFREMLNRVFFSFQRNYVPLVAGLLATACNLGLSWVLAQAIGIRGIALGASFSALVFVGLEIGYLLWWKPALIGSTLLKLLAAIATAALACYLVGYSLVAALPEWRPVARLAVVAGVVTVVDVCALLAAAWLLGIRRSTLLSLASGPAANPGPGSDTPILNA